MIIPDIMFYIFAAGMILFSALVVTKSNPVHAVLSLIVVFFCAAGLFILVGAEFVAFSLIIVYVGAVAILFLFVIMMLDINHIKIQLNDNYNIILGAVLGGLLMINLFLIFDNSSINEPSVSHSIDKSMTNTHFIGSVLYTDFDYAFITSGVVLLLAMFAAIALTLRIRPNVRKQDEFKQLRRDMKSGVELVNVEFNKGIDL